MNRREFLSMLAVSPLVGSLVHAEARRISYVYMQIGKSLVFLSEDLCMEAGAIRYVVDPRDDDDCKITLEVSLGSDWVRVPPSNVLAS